ncbi:PREDICTED: protein FAM188A homolog isoform X1 [Nicrophorus vespilloides]|uniref:Ubiquitin carboxyl-terminal hydrolase MINDY n=1 Tax=Nicrophorus vespilloides TaxID=110193 RepID=A0ABM1MCY2_NICVS|nr:PREDICTED: protein FAM188A homolog isoform X1 [Nicrophorus vespilloides]
MTETLPSVLQEDLLSIKLLLWGNDIKADIFSRWSQGFYFSQNEPSALEQTHGGPCSILAPVQAYIIKNLLLENETFDSKTSISEAKQNEMLQGALCEIVRQCSTGKYYAAYLDHGDVTAASETTINGDRPFEDALRQQTSTSFHPSKFHASLRLKVFSDADEFENYVSENVVKYKGAYGILLFLYSVIATKGLNQVRTECDTSEPLIDATYGYGSQSLINLMITGRAVTYVWDFEQDVGGLKLKGLERQSKIGFITLMEHLRYCTVGSFFKNPVHPVWVLGSETHLTVLFSTNKRLVSPETKSEQARRIFKNYDKDGNNFISSDKLQDVLYELELVSDEAYVDIMKKKLDSEHLGIILLNAFMDEFFPKEESSTPDTFQLMHYNGLGQSNYDGNVIYRHGTAILLESDLRAMCESNPMLTCLLTKWPTIEINWQDNVTPSLN